MPPRRDTDRHNEVVDAAIEIIRTKGFEATSLQDIADAVGIKKGSLVNYFSTKSDLADLVQARFTAVASDELGAIQSRTDLDAEQRLRELLRFHGEHCALRMSSPILVSFMQLWAPISTEQGRQQLKIREQYQAVFAGAVQECIRKRRFRKVDVDIVVNGLMGLMTWTAFWYDPAKHGDYGSVVDRLIDVAFDGLRPRPRTR